MNLLGRVLGMMLIASQVDLGGQWMKGAYVIAGLYVYAFFIHIDSFTAGYTKATEDMVKVRVNGD